MPQRIDDSFYAQMSFHGDSNIGLYGLATEKFCLMGSDLYAEKIRSVLRVPVYHVNIGQINLIKIFAVGNSSHLVVSSLGYEHDLGSLKKVISKHKVRMLVMETAYAIGNLILANDNGVILSPLLKKEKHRLEKFFGIPCEISTIAGLSVVGTMGIATNTGCLLSTGVFQKEIKIIEDVLGVEADIGTVCFGSPYPGAGIIANSHGFLTGTSTTGPEVGRITEALGFVE